MIRLRFLVTSVLMGLLLAGPIAAIALVSVPEDWRGPWVPYGTAVATVAVVFWARSGRQPPV